MLAPRLVGERVSGYAAWTTAGPSVGVETAKKGKNGGKLEFLSGREEDICSPPLETIRPPWESRILHKMLGIFELESRILHKMFEIFKLAVSN